MTSQPSRSRASTRISRPGIRGPTSARATLAAVFLVFAADDALFIAFWLDRFGRRTRVTKKPTTVASRGLLSKSHSTFDKPHRRRQRRRPAGLLVQRCQSRGETVWRRSGPVKRGLATKTSFWWRFGPSAFPVDG